MVVARGEDGRPRVSQRRRKEERKTCHETEDGHVLDRMGREMGARRADGRQRKQDSQHQSEREVHVARRQH
jgi:hypothetical protein